MAFADACDRIMALLRTQTWILQAPNDPPASATQFPFAALFPGTGTAVRQNDAIRQDMHTVHIEIHWAFRDMPRNTGDAKDRIDTLLNLFWGDITLNATVDTITDIGYEFGPMMWGTLDTLGYIIRLTFKRRVAQT